MPEEPVKENKANQEKAQPSFSSAAKGTREEGQGRAGDQQASTFVADRSAGSPVDRGLAPQETLHQERQQRRRRQLQQGQRGQREWPPEARRKSQRKSPEMMKKRMKRMRKKRMKKKRKKH